MARKLTNKKVGRREKLLLSDKTPKHILQFVQRELISEDVISFFDTVENSGVYLTINCTKEEIKIYYQEGEALKSLSYNFNKIGKILSNSIAKEVFDSINRSAVISARNNYYLRTDRFA